jgi:type I restriction enzyme S subunit
MQELLTKGIGHKEFKDTGIGRIPKEWEAVRVEAISLDLIGGGTPSTSNPSYWNGEVAWMTSAHINDREIKTGQRYITKEGLQNSATSVVPEGNLVVATRVGIGKAAINKIDIAISQDLTGIIINKNRSIPDFVYWFLVNNKNKLKSLAQGSTIKGILREGLGNLRLPLPPLPEQKRITAILTTLDKRLQLLREKRGRLGRVKKGLMNDLLTGKKRVKSNLWEELRYEVQN